MAAVSGTINGKVVGKRRECASVEEIVVAIDNWLSGEGTHRGVRIEVTMAEAAVWGVCASGWGWGTMLPLGDRREPVCVTVT